MLGSSSVSHKPYFRKEPSISQSLGQSPQSSIRIPSESLVPITTTAFNTTAADRQRVDTYLRGIINPEEERRLNRLIEGSARSSLSLDSFSLSSSAGSSGVFRYFDGGDDWSFLDSSSLGAPSSQDFSNLVNDIQTAMKRIFLPEYFFADEQARLTHQLNINANYRRTFAADNNLMIALNLGSNVLQVRGDYSKVNLALRIIFVSTAFFTLLGKVIQRPLLYKSSAALTAITTLFLGIAYYRYLMDEEAAVFNLRCHLN